MEGSFPARRTVLRRLGNGYRCVRFAADIQVSNVKIASVRRPFATSVRAG